MNNDMRNNVRTINCVIVAFLHLIGIYLIISIAVLCIYISVSLQTELRACTSCGEAISDRYFMEVGGCSWHGSCLRCCVCLSPLDRQPSCFLRERQVYCKADYTK